MLDEDDDLDVFEKTPYEDWIDDYWQYIPLDIRFDVGENFELLHFYNHIFCNVKNELTPLLLELAKKQYPIIKTETRPLIVKKINEYITQTIENCLWYTFQLLHAQKTGVDLRVEYPKLEEWKVRYARPPQPKLKDMSFFENFSFELTEDVKIKLLEEMNQEENDRFSWTENRVREFIDLVQTVLLNYYTEIFKLSSDGWIVYASNIRCEHFNYKMNFDEIHGFINYEFPEEYINLKYDEYYKKYQEAYKNRPDLRHRNLDE